NVVDVGDIEGAAALVRRIFLPVEIGLEGFGIERRAVVEFDAGAQLEGPSLEVFRMRPGQRELRLRLAAGIESGERVEQRGRRCQRRRVVDADLQRIEAWDIEVRGQRDS